MNRRNMTVKMLPALVQNWFVMKFETANSGGMKKVVVIKKEVSASILVLRQFL